MSKQVELSTVSNIPLTTSITVSEQDDITPPKPTSIWSWYNWGYFYDLILVICLFIGVSILHYVADKPFQQSFDPKDPDLSNPIGNSIISSQLLIVLGIVLPLVLGWIWYGGLALFGRLSIHDTLQSIHLYTLSVLLAQGVNILVTDFVKNSVGRLRPDFLTRCQYNATLGACTGDETIVDEGRRSFFSGHASISFTGLGFLSIWIFSLILRDRTVQGQNIITGKMYFKYRPGRAWRLVFALLPLLLAAYIAISRVQQRVHHPTDVITGSLFGFTLALIVYLIYYSQHQLENYVIGE